MKVKSILVILFLSLSNLVFSQGANIFTELTKKNDGKYYSKQTNELYSGLAYGKYKNNQIGMKGRLKDGVFDGVWEWWYEDGSKKRKTTYVLGKKEGMSYWWFKNGQIKSEIRFLHNKNIEQKRWDEKGNRLPNPKMGGR